MNEFPPLRISVKEGPVVLQSLGGAGVSASYDLWDGAVASEFFPRGTDSAFYILTLEKPVAKLEQLRKVEDELISALKLIATAWSFAGGSYMAIETREVLSSTRFESNAGVIEQKMLRDAGLSLISSVGRIGIETVETYSRPPLAHAIAIVELMRRDFVARQLLTYFHMSWIEYHRHPRADTTLWFVNLYKVRDLLDSFYGNGKTARSALGISNRQWSDFGNLLNNHDLRHAEISGLPPLVPPEHVEGAYAAARQWITAYLGLKGLAIGD